MKKVSTILVFFLLSVATIGYAGTKEDESVAINLQKCQKFYDQNSRIIYLKDKNNLQQATKFFWEKIAIAYSEEDVKKMKKEAILSSIFSDQIEISDQYSICRDIADNKARQTQQK